MRVHFMGGTLTVKSLSVFSYLATKCFFCYSNKLPRFWGTHFKPLHLLRVACQSTLSRWKGSFLPWPEEDSSHVPLHYHFHNAVLWPLKNILHWRAGKSSEFFFISTWRKEECSRDALLGVRQNILETLTPTLTSPLRAELWWPHKIPKGAHLASITLCGTGCYSDGVSIDAHRAPHTTHCGGWSCYLKY